MKPTPENVEGQVVRSHEYRHSLEHKVNWSHVLLAGVVLITVWKLTPVAAEVAGSGDRDDVR